VLDSMDLERERGITIKAQTAALQYKPATAATITQPDRHTGARRFFLRSVALSRGLRRRGGGGRRIARGGSTDGGELLHRDRAGRGSGAGAEQDRPAFGRPGRAIREIEDVIGIDARSACASAPRPGRACRKFSRRSSRASRRQKAIPTRRSKRSSSIPGSTTTSRGDAGAHDDGTLCPKDKILLMSSGTAQPVRAGRRVHAEIADAQRLSAGEVVSSFPASRNWRRPGGDTVTLADRPAAAALPGFKVIKTAGVRRSVPVEANHYDSLRDALTKLKLNDASLQYEPEVSQPGLRLPLRLSRPAAYGHRAGAPRARVRHEPDHHRADVVYEVLLADGTVQRVENPAKMPDASRIAEIREPIINHHHFPAAGTRRAIMTLCTQKRGVQKNMQYTGRHVMLTYEMPLSEVVMDFFDKLKSASRGYASLDYEFKEYRASEVVNSTYSSTASASTPCR